MSRLSRIGVLGVLKLLSRGKDTSLSTPGFVQGLCRQFWKPQFELHPEIKGFRSSVFQRHQYSTSASSGDSATDGDGGTEKISVTFVDKDGEEQHIKVPVGMSMLEAAHENDIELEGACEGSLACSTCHVIVMDMEYYNKLEDPTDEENDMLDLAFGLTETSRLGCQVIARPELDGIRLAIPAATRNFAVDGYVPKPH
ncbi:Adrenodoxin-like protein 2, mitochondrial [Turnera subulata]|uniref:Adrenodoxin-like protein 2, mitochondrial n=1 Tax=Turnera subulata TaxID=218843 RepID=A0A9Q0J035_9ROSI|nr:Adrenodoxin-like protein 2, mitochondrial [Turnera subulata]